MLNDLLFFVAGVLVASAYPQVIPAVKWGMSKVKAFFVSFTKQV